MDESLPPVIVPLRAAHHIVLSPSRQFGSDWVAHERSPDGTWRELLQSSFKTVVQLLADPDTHHKDISIMMTPLEADVANRDYFLAYMSGDRGLAILCPYGAFVNDTRWASVTVQGGSQRPSSFRTFIYGNRKFVVDEPLLQMPRPNANPFDPRQTMTPSHTQGHIWIRPEITALQIDLEEAARFADAERRHHEIIAKGEAAEREYARRLREADLD
jgi:hypothetical protein